MQLIHEACYKMKVRRWNRLTPQELQRESACTWSPGTRPTVNTSPFWRDTIRRLSVLLIPAPGCGQLTWFHIPTRPTRLSCKCSTSWQCPEPVLYRLEFTSGKTKARRSNKCRLEIDYLHMLTTGNILSNYSCSMASNQWQIFPKFLLQLQHWNQNIH